MRAGWWLILISIVVLLPGAAVFAKEPLRWQAATVVYSHHELRNDPNVAGTTGVVQAAHELLDLDAGDVTYTAEQWVVPSRLLRLPEGSPVQISISGKAVAIKTEDGKVRKLKLIATHPKHKKQ